MRHENFVCRWPVRTMHSILYMYTYIGDMKLTRWRMDVCLGARSDAYLSLFLSC